MLRECGGTIPDRQLVEEVGLAIAVLAGRGGLCPVDRERRRVIGLVAVDLEHWQRVIGQTALSTPPCAGCDELIPLCRPLVAGLVLPAPERHQLLGRLAAVMAPPLTARGRSRDDLLWPSNAGGYLGPPSSVRSWLSGAVERCRAADDTFPVITAHDLRHTAASLAISAGANPKVVQRMLGHASAAMTLDVYADLFESDLDAVAENVSKMWPRRVQSG